MNVFSTQHGRQTKEKRLCISSLRLSGVDQGIHIQKTAARPFLECRLLNLFLPLMDSPSSPFRNLPVVGILTPSSASLLPSVLVGLESVELSSLKVESPEYVFVRDCPIAKSLARSMLSIHSRAAYMLPSGSLATAFGSSKRRCLEGC